MKTHLGLLCLFIALPAAATQVVDDVRAYTDPKTGLTVLSGQVRLPGPGLWSLDDGQARAEGL